MPEHQATRFLHLWWSLATLFAPLHVTCMPCRSSADVMSRVICGLYLDLFRLSESSSWQHVQAWLLAVFTLGLFPVHGSVCRSDFCLSTWPASLSLRVFTISDVDCIPDLRINSYLSYSHTVTLYEFSGYITCGIHLKWSGCELSISMSRMHEVLSIAQSSSRGGIWQCCWWSILTTSGSVVERLKRLCPILHVYQGQDLIWRHWQLVCNQWVFTYQVAYKNVPNTKEHGCITSRRFLVPLGTFILMHLQSHQTTACLEWCNYSFVHTYLFN